VVPLKWKSANKGGYYEYKYDFYGAVSLYGLDDVLAGSKYQYCQIQTLVKNRFAILPKAFFETYHSTPKLELLIKLGFHRTALEICGAHDSWNKSKIVFDNIKFMMANRCEIIAKERNIEFIQAWAVVGNPTHVEKLIQRNMLRDGVQLFQDWHIGVDAFMNYESKQGTDFRISDYIDMLRNLAECGKDLKDTKNIFPYDFKAKHDEAAALARMKKNEKYAEGIIKAFEELAALEWSNDRYIIRPVKDSDELTAEAVALKHCVDSYADRIAKRETSVFVLRCIEDPDKPLVTVEYKDKKIEQARGLNNRSCEKDQQAFLDAWLKKIRGEQRKAPQKPSYAPAMA
jgi:hypothetical protein